ncbi:hypothetical protein K9L05_02980 [Candidatus Babeliales bacterium]|nr:hypothetical protein [Candidatus Babeliales bacterium]
MNFKKIFFILNLTFIILIQIFFVGCIKDSKFDSCQNNKRIKLTEEDVLDFAVKNKTGGTIFVTCFYYIQTEPFTRWRWDKSKVYKIEQGQKAIIDLDVIPDVLIRRNVYGYLAVFASEKKAQESIFETLDERHLLDLDLLYKLKNKKIAVKIEKYGYKDYLLDYDVEYLLPEEKDTLIKSEVDFLVKNNTGKPVLVTCFVYQKKENRPIWQYSKTPVIKLENNQLGIVDVDTIVQRVYKEEDIENIFAYLAVFDENEKEDAQDSTYELLKEYKKLYVGPLILLKDKKIVLEIEKYGIAGDFIDYRKVDIKKAQTKQLKIKK